MEAFWLNILAWLKSGGNPYLVTGYYLEAGRKVDIPLITVQSDRGGSCLVLQITICTENCIQLLLDEIQEFNLSSSMEVVSLAFQLFESSVKLYSYYTNSKNVGEMTNDIRINLIVLRTKYELWGEDVGLNDQLDSSRFIKIAKSHLSLIIDILTQIQNALATAGDLMKRYMGSGSSTTTILPMTNTNNGLDLQKAIDERAQSHNDIAKQIKERTSILTKMKFAFYDKGKFDVLIVQLKQLTSNLEDLTSHYRKSLDGKLIVQLLKTTSASDLSALSAATHVTYPTISELANRKARYTQLCEANARRKVGRLNISNDNGLSIDHSAIQLKGSDNDVAGRQLATYRGVTDVLLEWKTIPKEMNEIRTIHRVGDVATFLLPDPMDPSKHTDTHVLPCIGYYREPGRMNQIALVYRTIGVGHKTLSELITNERLAVTFNLGTRMRLALTLAECLFFLHTTGWLHKSIRSENIVLFGSPQNPSESTFRAYLVGFNTARLDQAGEISEKVDADTRADVYQHPSYQFSNRDDSGYTRQYDIYSLGIILLELANMRSIFVIGTYNPKSHDPKKFLTRILDRGAVADLSFTVGNSYKRAVEWCLRGQFEEGVGKEKFAALPSDKQGVVFWEKVVVELAKTTVPE